MVKSRLNPCPSVLPRHHHHRNSITPKCLISILLLNASDPPSPPYMKSIKVTTSCHHELHEPSLVNTLTGIQVSTQRSLQDASALHVVGMLHSLLTTPSKSMVLLHKSVQPLHRLISNMSHQQIHLHNVPALALLIGCP